MAIRIRKDGRILCAALTEAEDGDTYIDDALHYEMSVVHGVLCTTKEPEHSNTGDEWWWTCNPPAGREVDAGYLQRYTRNLSEEER